MSWKCEGCGKDDWSYYFDYCGNCGTKKPAKKRRLAEELKRLDLGWTRMRSNDNNPLTDEYSNHLSEGLVEFIGKVYGEYLKTDYPHGSFQNHLKEELL